MWTEALVPQAPIWDTILRTALVYIAVAFLLRLAGKRGLAELSTFDVIVALLLAEIIGGSVLSDDQSITSAVIAAFTLVAMNVLFNAVVHRFPAAARFLQGTATTVITDGDLDEKAMRKLGITSSEIDHAIRSQHGDDVSEVQHAELTPSGKLVLTLKYEEQSATKADIHALTERLDELRSLLQERD